MAGPGRPSALAKIAVGRLLGAYKSRGGKGLVALAAFSVAVVIELGRAASCRPQGRCCTSLVTTINMGHPIGWLAVKEDQVELTLGLETEPPR
jgi:hypothetical protein